VSTATDHRVGVALAVIAAFGFSFKAIFVKLAYPYGVDAVTLLVLRMGFALPVFAWVGFVASRSAPALSGRDWVAIMLLGLLGYYGASILDFLGLQYISAGLERLILFTYPTLTLLLAWAVQGIALQRRHVLALLLCYGGIALAFAHDVELAGDLVQVGMGAALVFGSSACYALYLYGSGRMLQRIGTARFTALAILVSSAASFAHFALQGEPGRLVQPWPVYALGVAMALFSTVIPIFAQSAAMRRIGSGEAALLGMIGPLLTIVFAAWLLGEAMSLPQFAGMALVIAGIVVSSRRSEPAVGKE
jgi:drug/metabolite transporter (DMT)-like permease